MKPRRSFQEHPFPLCIKMWDYIFNEKVVKKKNIVMASGGYEPLPDRDDYEPPGLYRDDDDDNADQTGAFVPFSSSAPGTYRQEIEFQTTQKEKSGFPKTSSLLEDLTELPGLSKTTSAAEGEIGKEFPNADKIKIKYMMDRKGRTRVGLISPKKLITIC